jgi:hypothetical protein
MQSKQCEERGMRLIPKARDYRQGERQGGGMQDEQVNGSLFVEAPEGQ